MTLTKDTALELLEQGNIEEFNTQRPYGKEDLFDLSEVDFTGISLSGVNLSYADLNGADFTEVEMDCIDFSNSDLTSASFARANLTECEFSGANLNGAFFVGANCFASFADADLSGADFSAGDFSESDFTLALNMSMCKFDSDTVWPDSSDLPDDFDAEFIPDKTDEGDDTSSPDYY
jgi:uncharacterized protein YjbI with pentapeptide repeats